MSQKQTAAPGAEEEIIQALISQYNTPVPRYTSYPTALEFESDFSDAAFLDALEKMTPDKPVSVYIHIPFCEVRCHYCGCNVIISRRKEMLDPFLQDLFAEMQFKLSRIPFQPKLAQLHFGGGTPNFLRQDDWDKILQTLRELFVFEEDVEISTELNPMEFNREGLEHLRELGFNRVSFGVQDVNEQTQNASGRPQDMDHIEDLIAHSRHLGFDSVNVDFIYGLPFQTVETYGNNLRWIKQIRPDRLAVFSYAHIPWIKKHQNNMPQDKIPDTAEKLRIYLLTRKYLKQLGYVEIGMDHYALPDDPLSKALEARQLHRNFMGYTTMPDANMLAFGPSAISFVDGVFAQNHVKLRAYEHSAREENELFEKGYAMTPEDRLRGKIIHSLMNNLFLDIRQIEDEYRINFQETFAYELQKLKHFIDEGLVNAVGISEGYDKSDAGESDQNESYIEVTQTGLHVVRHIASTFDIYRRPEKQTSQQNRRFSRGI